MVDMKLRILAFSIFILVVGCAKETPQKQLTVNVTPDIGGSVTPSTGTYAMGSTVKLTANPSAEYVFKEWQGGITGTINPANVIMDGDKTVTAVFEKRQYPLGLTIIGLGSVKEEIIKTASSATNYTSGTTVRLTPQPSAGYQFKRWSGDDTTAKIPLDLVVSKPINLICTFEKMAITSLKIENPIDTLVISKKHKYIIKGVYTDGTTIDLSDSVNINVSSGLNKLSDNTILAKKSGVDTIQITKGLNKISVILNVKDFEYLPINSDLLKNNGAEIQVPIIIISYIPTENGIDLNLKEGPDGYDRIHNSSLDNVKKKILNESIMAKKIWEEGSRFRNFNSTNSSYQINIQPVAYINVYKMEFIQTATNREIDYKKLFEKTELSNIINSRKVKEIWFNHFPLYDKPAISNNKSLYPDTKLFWGMDESNMSSPTTPDISNSSRVNDLPILNHTYVVYAFNQSMGISNHVHCRGHQLEAQLSYIENEVIYPPAKDIEKSIFWGKFVGITNNSGGWDFKPGRVGRTHNPPNTYDNEQYQYSNSRKFLSDIKDWNPNGGKFEEIDHTLWNNQKYNFDFGSYQGFGAQSYTSEVNWLIFLFQSIPGKQNNINFNINGTSKSISDWWDIFYNWDEAVKKKKKLYY